MLNILYRSMKWRVQNPITIVITLIQPLLWMMLYGTVGASTMHSTTGNYNAFILPGIMVLVTFSACCGGGIINYITKNNGSFYRILLSPVKRVSIVFGQTFETVILSFIEISVLMVIALFFSVSVPSDPLSFLSMLIILFLTAFFLSCLTYTMSLLLPNEVVYETVMNAIVLPTFFLSSALFPSETLSKNLYIVIYLNPFSHVINILRKILMNEPFPAREFFSVSLLLLILCIITFSCALYRLKKETAK